jgi:hypothetical protein
MYVIIAVLGDAENQLSTLARILYFVKASLRYSTRTSSVDHVTI